MARNVGPVDRVVRVAAGIALLALIPFAEGNARYLGLIGLVPLLTAAVRYCPLYKVLGVTTCPLRRAGTAALLLLAVAASAAGAGETGEALPENFRSWTHTKSMVIPDKSHGLYGFHNIYANTTALPVLKKGGTYPDGSAFVVSFYDVETADGATVQGKKRMDVLMVKDAKKAAKTGGWLYAAFGPDGKPDKSVDPVKGCYECHTQAKGSDFVFSKYVD